MKKFIARKKELAVLNKRYNSDQFEMLILYGSYGLGKTTLVQEFIKDKPSIVLHLSKDCIFDPYNELTRVVNEYVEKRNQENECLRNYDDVFKTLAKLSKDERVVFVIDEYPYLAYKTPSIASILQEYIDLVFKETKLFIILVGSDVCFMDYQVLGYNSPLYGRRTFQMKLKQFDYYDTGLWFPLYTSEEKAYMYALTNGIPAYLEMFDASISFDENIKMNTFVNEIFLKKYVRDGMEEVYKEMCKQYLYNHIMELPFLMKECRLNEFNDLVVSSLTSNEEIIGSCKFKNSKVGMEELELMKEYGNVMKPKSNKYYYFFSKNGFDEAILQQDVVLISLDDMY